MKILCITCMFNRHKISAIFLEGMKRLGIEVIAGVSDFKSAELCNNTNTKFIFLENRPLGLKFNRVLKEAMKLDWTHLMISGDDDLYLNDITEIYLQNKDLACIGFNSLYYIEPLKQKAALFSFNNFTTGAGRLIRRDTIEKLLITNNTLWKFNANSGLDRSMQESLLKIGVIPKVIFTSEPVMIDIKSEQNIWKFHTLIRFKNKIINSVPYDSVLKRIPEKERNMISNLHNEL